MSRLEDIYAKLWTGPEDKEPHWYVQNIMLDWQYYYGQDRNQRSKLYNLLSPDSVLIHFVLHSNIGQVCTN